MVELSEQGGRRTHAPDHYRTVDSNLCEISLDIGEFSSAGEHASQSIVRYKIEDHHRLIGGLATIQRSFALCIGPCRIGSWAEPIWRLLIATRPSRLLASWATPNPRHRPSSTRAGSTR